MDLPLKMQCQTEGCVNYKQCWEVQQEDVAVSSRLTGLYDMPDLRCRGCHTEPHILAPDEVPLD